MNKKTEIRSFYAKVKEITGSDQTATLLYNTVNRRLKELRFGKDSGVRYDFLNSISGMDFAEKLFCGLSDTKDVLTRIANLTRDQMGMWWLMMYFDMAAPQNEEVPNDNN